MFRWAALAACLAAALISLSSRVTAQQSGNTAQTLEQIRQRMEQGLALFVGGSYEQAAAQFEQGYAEHPYSAFLFNAGVCYQKWNKPEPALAKFREYLKVDPQAPDADNVR
jgi:tetratricopeptide (TPR) repeat protein